MVTDLVCWHNILIKTGTSCFVNDIVLNYAVSTNSGVWEQPLLVPPVSRIRQSPDAVQHRRLGRDFHANVNQVVEMRQ
jgi:hypothetical protein